MSSKSLKKRFSSKEVPFLVTLLLALAGWAIGHIVDRVLALPIVEYRTIVAIENGEKHVRVSLENLSKQAFYALKFEIQDPKGKAKIVPCKGALHSKPPAWSWDVRPTPGTGGVTFEVVQFHPGWQISMCAKSAQDFEPHFYLRESGSGEQDRAQPILLVEPSLSTFLVRYELALFKLLALLAGLFAAFWFYFSDPVD